MLKLLIEPYCELCGRELAYSELETGICENCINEIKFLDLDNSCVKCSLPEVGENCPYCRDLSFVFERNFSLFDYKGSIKNIFFEIKFNQSKEKTKVFHRLLEKLDIEEIIGMKIDLIVPVPSSPLVYFKRGFNLVNEIFKPISSKWGIEFLEVLGRKFFYKSQKKLSKSERAKEIAKQFFVRKKVDLSNKVALIVDDVFTTGNTINTCATLLRSLGVLKVYSLTLFRANLI